MGSFLVSLFFFAYLLVVFFDTIAPSGELKWVFTYLEGFILGIIVGWLL